MGGGGSIPSGKDYETIGDIVRRQLADDKGEEPVRNVFISFANEDKSEVELLRGQAKNSNSGMEFHDHSLRVPFDSTRAEYIKNGIRKRIDRSSVALVYLTEASASSQWVNWEIREANARGKGIIGVYKGDHPPAHLPPALRECGGKVVRWTQDGVTAAIQEAAKNR